MLSCSLNPAVLTRLDIAVDSRSIRIRSPPICVLVEYIFKKQTSTNSLFSLCATFDFSRFVFLFINISEAACLSAAIPSSECAHILIFAWIQSLNACSMHSRTRQRCILSEGSRGCMLLHGNGLVSTCSFGFFEISYGPHVGLPSLC